METEANEIALGTAQHQLSLLRSILRGLGQNIRGLGQNSRGLGHHDLTSEARISINIFAA